MQDVLTRLAHVASLDLSTSCKDSIALKELGISPPEQVDSKASQTIGSNA